MNLATADTLERSPALRWVVMGSSALGLGGLLASLTVLQQSEFGLEFRWSDLAVPAFAGGAVLASAYWWLVFRLGAGADGRSSRRLLYASSGILLLLAIGVFLYPLRFVAEDRRNDVLIGLGIAAGALSCVGYMIRTVVRLLEDDDADAPPDRRP